MTLEYKGELVEVSYIPCDGGSRLTPPSGEEFEVIGEERPDEEREELQEIAREKFISAGEP